MVREKGCVCLELCPCPMSILINTLSPCHLKSKTSIYFIYPARIKYKVFEKVVLKVRTTTRVISLDKIYNGVIYFIPYVNIQYTIYNIHIHQ